MLWTIALRTVIIYFLVLFFLRLMGKREIGKLSVFDLVISIMIAEIAVLVLEDPKKPMAHGLLPMALLVCIQIVVAYITLKSEKLRRWMDGRPSVIIENGKLNRNEMRKQRYTLDDLMLQLRENRITNPNDVEFAVLETTGKLSVKEKSSQNGGQQGKEQTGEAFCQVPSGKDQSGKKQSGVEKSGKENSGKAHSAEKGFRYEGLPVALIMDGKVQDENLEKIGKTRFWLKNELQKYGIRDFKDVFFCTYDHKGKMYIDRKK